MATRQVELGRELFHFTGFRHWINKAAGWCAPHEGDELVFLDERDDAFPVRVYLAHCDE